MAKIPENRSHQLTRRVYEEIRYREGKRFNLDHDDIKLDLLLVDHADRYSLEVGMTVDSLGVVLSNGGPRLQVRMVLEGEGEIHETLLEFELTDWFGCLHHGRSRTMLDFPKGVKRGSPRVLEVSILNSRLFLSVAGS